MVSKSGKDDKKNLATAFAEYEEVTETATVDLKELIASVKAASKAKTEKTKKTKVKAAKVAKKRKQNEDKEYELTQKGLELADKYEADHKKALDEVHKLQVQTPIKETEAYQAFGIAIQKLRAEMRMARVAFGTLPKNRIKELNDLWEDAKAKYLKVEHDFHSRDLDEELTRTGQAIKAFSRVSQRQTTLSKAFDFVGDKLISRDEKGVIQLRKSFGLAASMVGHKLAAGGGKAKEFLKDKTVGAAGRGYDAAFKFMERQAAGNVKVVAAIRKVDKTLRATGSAVAAVGKNTLAWVTSKFGSMFSSMWRFLKRPLGGEDMFQKLLGLAILGPTLLAPILEGIVSELNKEFGDDWFKGIANKLWDKTKSYLLDAVKGLLGIGKPGPNMAEAPPAATMSRQANVETRLLYKAQKGTEPIIPIKAGGAAKPQSPEQEIATHLDAYDHSWFGFTKNIQKDTITKLIASNPGLTINAPLYARLKAAGFNVSSLQTPGATTASPSATAAGVSTASRPTATTPSVTDAPAQPPMESAAPVTAQAPAAVTKQDTTATNAPAGRGIAPGLAVGQIPTTMTGDGLNVHNLGMMHGAQ